MFSKENLLGDLSIRWRFAKGCYVYWIYDNEETDN